MTTTPQPITNPQELRRLCDDLGQAAFVAVDTEFIRDRTYFARLCLVQLATPETIALVDPLALSDLEPLRELLMNPGVVKVLHSGRQDLEIFHDLWQRVPAPVFDTQVAATVLGFGEQAGYGRLVQEITGIALDKAGTLTDWSRRPLSHDQLEYAAADVRHLVTVYTKVLGALEESGRLAWLDAEFAALTNPDLYRSDAAEAWRLVKGARSLKPPQHAALRELAAWREHEAQERNHPRRWVLSDEALIEIARRRPRRVEDLVRIRGLSERWIAQSGAAILALVERAGATEDGAPSSDLAPPPIVRPSKETEPIADLMACLVRMRAQEHGVTASLLAPRVALERVAEEGEQADVAVLSGWRRSVVGEDLLALRAGRLRLVVRDGAVRAEPAD